MGGSSHSYVTVYQRVGNPCDAEGGEIFFSWLHSVSPWKISPMNCFFQLNSDNLRYSHKKKGQLSQQLKSSDSTMVYFGFTWITEKPWKTSDSPSSPARLGGGPGSLDRTPTSRRRPGSMDRVDDLQELWWRWRSFLGTLWLWLT